MSVSELSRGGLKTQFNRTSSIADKFKANASTTTTVSGKSNVAQSAAAALKTATRVDVSRDMMSSTGSILSKSKSSNQVAVSSTPHSSSQVHYSGSGNKKTGSRPANGFVPSGHAAQQEYKFNAIRRSHIGPFLENGNYYSKRAEQRQLDKMGLLNAYQAQCNETDKFMNIAMGINTIAQAVGTVWDAFDSKVETQSAGKSDGSNPATSAQTGDSSESSTQLSSMKKASNSLELASAISIAKADNTDLVNNKLPKAQEKLTNLQSQTSNLKTAFETAQKNYDTISAKVTAKTTEIANKQKLVGQEGRGVTIATIEQLKSELKQLEEEQRKLEQERTLAKQKYDANTEACNIAKETVNTLTALQNKYKTEIPEQEKRLADMQFKEGQKADNAEIEANGIYGDATTKHLAGKDKKGNKLNAKAQNMMNAVHDTEMKIELSRHMNNVGTTSFSTCKFNGKDVYAVNGRVVDENTYNTQLQKAQNQQLSKELTATYGTLTQDSFKTSEVNGQTVYQINGKDVTAQVYTETSEKFAKLSQS